MGGTQDQVSTSALPKVTQSHMDTCVSYLLLTCPHHEVRDRIATVIMSSLSSDNASSSSLDMSHAVANGTIRECVYNILISKLNASQSFCTEYFKLILALIRDELERESSGSSFDPRFTSQGISDYLIQEILQIGHKMGLKNQGNTCYMNAALQQLVAIPEIRTAVLRCQPPDKETDTHGSKQLIADTLHQNARGQRNSKDVIRETMFTFECLHAKKRKTHDPVKLVTACRDLGMRFDPFETNDPHEFLNLLIPQLEKWINADPSGLHKDVIENCFGGCAQTVKTCKNCKLVTVTQRGTFKELLVEVKPSLEECLIDYVKDENVHVECTQCKKRTSTSKTDTVCKLPQVETSFCVHIFRNVRPLNLFFFLDTLCYVHRY